MTENASETPLFVIKGDATDEQVAAVVAVLQGLAGASAPAAAPKPRSQWASPHRAVRRPLAGGWVGSGLPQ